MTFFAGCTFDAYIETPIEKALWHVSHKLAFVLADRAVPADTPHRATAKIPAKGLLILLAQFPKSKPKFIIENRSPLIGHAVPRPRFDLWATGCA